MGRFHRRCGQSDFDLRGHSFSPHWSYYVDAEGSLMHGKDWVDNGDGSFTATTGVHTRFSPVDL